MGKTSCLFALAITVLSSAALADSTIVILRHGEKPASGLGQLSCQGLNRALALPQVLLPRYGAPVAIYAPNPAIRKEDKGVSYAYVRPLATVEPLAIRAGLPVAIDWSMTEVASLATKLLERKDGTQVVAWEHHWAEKLARQLLVDAGGNPEEVPRWPDEDFDSLFVLRISSETSGKRQVSFSHEQQGLTQLSEICPN